MHRAALEPTGDALRPVDCPAVDKSGMHYMTATTSLKKVFGSFATGVAVITTHLDGRHFGFTANSFTSVSLLPPVVLFCIGRTRASYDAFHAARSFNVNILSASQRKVSDRFARSGVDKWDGIEFTEDLVGNAVLADAVASISCRKISMIDQADHAVVFGEVLEFSQCPQRLPLIYYRSGYCLPTAAPADDFASV